MKVRAVIGFAGIGFSVAAGEAIDLPEAVAKSAIAQKYAVPIEPVAVPTEEEALEASDAPEDVENDPDAEKMEEVEQPEAEDHSETEQPETADTVEEAAPKAAKQKKQKTKK